MMIQRDLNLERRVSLRHIFPYRGLRAVHCATATERIPAGGGLQGHFDPEFEAPYREGWTALRIGSQGDPRQTGLGHPLQREAVDRLLELPNPRQQRLRAAGVLAAAICGSHWMLRERPEYQARYADAMADAMTRDPMTRDPMELADDQPHAALAQLRAPQHHYNRLGLTLRSRWIRTRTTQITLEAPDELGTTMLRTVLTQRWSMPVEARGSGCEPARIPSANLILSLPRVGPLRPGDSDGPSSEIAAPLDPTIRIDREQVMDLLYHAAISSRTQLVEHIVACALHSIASRPPTAAWMRDDWRDGLTRILDAYGVRARGLRSRIRNTC